MSHPLIYFLLLLSSSLALAASASIPGQNGDFSCGNGVQGRVTQVQRESIEPFQPNIFITDCSALKGNSPSLPDTSPNSPSLISNPLDARRENRLGSRQLISKCGSDCATVCSLGSSGPSPGDCSTLSTYLFGRGSQFSVGAWQKVSVTWGTCMYTFLNTNLFSVSWCDNTWAAQGGSISGSCSAGGTCLGFLFTVGVEVNPNPPPPPPPSAPSSSPQPSSSQNAPSSSSNTGGQGQPDTQPSSTTRSTPNPSSNANGASITSVSRSTVPNNAGITEFSSVLAASNIAELSSSLRSLSTLTVTSSYARTTTLSNGAVITVISSPGSVGFGNNDGNQGNSEGGHSKRLGRGVIAAIILAVFFAIGILIFFLLWRKKKEAKKVPPPIYIDPSRASAYDGDEKVPNSPVAYTIHSNDGDDDRAFGRVFRNSRGGYNASPSSGRVNSTMSGETDATIWTPRAKDQHRPISSTLSPVMLNDVPPSLQLDSPATSSSGHQHQYHYTKVSGNTSNVVHPNLAGMGAPTLTIISPTASPSSQPPELNSRFMTLYDDDRRTTDASRVADANSEDDHSCYSNEQLDEARANDAGVHLERVSAPPVIIPSEFASPLSGSRLLDGARLSAGTRASHSSRSTGPSLHVPSLPPTPRAQRTTFGVENNVPPVDLGLRKSVDTAARRSGRVSGSVVGMQSNREEEEEENEDDEAYTGFTRLTTAFESASSVGATTDTEASPTKR